MRSPAAAPATAAPRYPRPHATASAFESAGVWCEYAHAYQGPLHLQGHRVVQDKLVLWLGDGPSVHLRVGPKAWEYRPRGGLLDYFPQGEIDTVHIGAGPLHALLFYLPRGRDSAARNGQADFASQVELQFSDARLQRIASQLEQAAAHPGPRLPAFDEYLAHALVARLEERHESRRGTEPQSDALAATSRRVVVDYIEHALGSNISVAALAALIGYHPSRFMRAFQASLGIPPHRYLLQRRVARAQELLRASELSLTAIALHLGFASHAHFSTTFRRATGSPPSEFRRGMRDHAKRLAAKPCAQR
jgi:AraC-like DNA-binding protein